MLEPWNDLSLLPPPLLTAVSNNIDVAHLRYICSSIINVLSKQSPLHREGAVLSRFVYKFDKKFRNDIGYRNIRKVNTALRKYLLLDMLKHVEYFESALPLEDDNYFPTRQMLQFFMVKLITFSKLMLRINVCSKQASIFYLDRIKRGERHWMCLMPYAVLSRLWSISLVLIQSSITWYTSLHPFLYKLQAKGLDLLPHDYVFPQDLSEWLDFKNIDSLGKLEWTKKKHENIANLLGDDLNEESDDTFETILSFVKNINDNIDEVDDEKQILENKNIKQFNISMPKPTDQGEAISRESFNILQATNIQKKMQHDNDSFNHCSDRVTNMSTLQDFISKEESYRMENDNKSLTSHLSLMQWHALKNSLDKLCLTLTHSNRKIERKFQKIWKEKCLEYK